MESQSIPLFDMDRHLEAHRNVFDSCFKRVLDSSSLVLGNEVHKFEKDFASYLGIGNCVGVANGTDALEIALRALGANTNSNVALVGNAGGYARTAIDKIGARPVYIEVEPKTLTMSLQNLKQVLNTDSLDIIIVTHLYGQVYPEILELVKIAQDKNVWLIEDCAQSHGASLNGKKSGTFGVIGTFSFYPTKNLGALGDGGAIVCDDVKLCNYIRSLRQYGWKAKYYVENKFGTNSRLDELQAAFLRNLLPLLDSWNNSRRIVAISYLKGINNPKVRLPIINIDSYVGHLFPIYVTDVIKFNSYLNRNDVGFGNHYPIQDQFQKAWLNENIGQKFNSPELPVTIPISQYILHSEVQTVIDIINDF